MRFTQQVAVVTGAELASRAKISVCVDDADNIAQMSRAALERGVSLGILAEVDIGMGRCGVEPGEAALELARRIQVPEEELNHAS